MSRISLLTSICLLLIPVALLLLVPAQRDVLSTTSQLYFVSNLGDDSNPGTQAQPWKTVAKVNTMNLNPGDNVLFSRGGVWTEDLKVSDSGTVSNHIIIGAYGTGPAPILRSIEAIETHNLTIEFLHFKDSSDFGINLYHSDNTIIQEVEVQRAVQSNIFVGHSDNVIIRKVKSHDSLNEHGLYLSGEVLNGTDFPLVEDSEFYNNKAAGIQLNASHRYRVKQATIQRNRIYNNVMGINDIGSDGTKLQYNLIYNNKNAEIYISHDKNTESAGIPYSAINGRYYNNVIFNHGSLVWGNVVYVDMYATGFKFKNNIVDVPAYSQIEVFPIDTSTIEIDYNCYSSSKFNWKGSVKNSFIDWKVSSGKDANSVNSPPSFVATNNFALASNSACLDKGANVGLTSDFAKNQVPKNLGVDIGAYEYQAVLTTSSAISSLQSSISPSSSASSSQTSSVSTSANACRADYNNNGQVDISDFQLFAQNYKRVTANCNLDLVGNDCYLNLADFSAFARNYKQATCVN